MRVKHAAGLVLVRHQPAGLRYLLVHPGGPYFARRDAGVWSIPKGLVEDGEDRLAAARREFGEETGWATPDGGYIELGAARQSKKLVHAWAFVGDAELTTLRSNAFELEWPPKSGQLQAFPEVDRADFFDLPTAREKIVAAQFVLLERAAAALSGRAG